MATYRITQKREFIIKSYLELDDLKEIIEDNDIEYELDCMSEDDADLEIDAESETFASLKNIQFEYEILEKLSFNDKLNLVEYKAKKKNSETNQPSIDYKYYDEEGKILPKWL